MSHRPSILAPTPLGDRVLNGLLGNEHALAGGGDGDSLPRDGQLACAAYQFLSRDVPVEGGGQFEGLRFKRSGAPELLPEGTTECFVEDGNADRHERESAHRDGLVDQEHAERQRPLDKVGEEAGVISCRGELRLARGELDGQLVERLGALRRPLDQLKDEPVLGLTPRQRRHLPPVVARSDEVVSGLEVAIIIKIEGSPARLVPARIVKVRRRAWFEPQLGEGCNQRGCGHHGEMTSTSHTEGCGPQAYAKIDGA